MQNVSAQLGLVRSRQNQNLESDPPLPISMDLGYVDSRIATQFLQQQREVENLKDKVSLLVKLAQASPVPSPPPRLVFPETRLQTSHLSAGPKQRLFDSLAGPSSFIGNGSAAKPTVQLAQPGYPSFVGIGGSELPPVIGGATRSIELAELDDYPVRRVPEADCIVSPVPATPLKKEDPEKMEDPPVRNKREDHPAKREDKKDDEPDDGEAGEKVRSVRLGYEHLLQASS
jgi:hypothetical protein